MQILPGVAAVLDPKELVGVIVGARFSLLRTVPALTGEVVALARIMTPARDGN
jgi:hypothetical protein